MLQLSTWCGSGFYLLTLPRFIEVCVQVKWIWLQTKIKEAVGKLQFFHFFLLEIAEYNVIFSVLKSANVWTQNLVAGFWRDALEAWRKLLQQLSHFWLFVKWHWLPNCYQRLSTELLRYFFVRYIMYAQNPCRLSLFFIVLCPSTESSHLNSDSQPEMAALAGG